MEAACKSMLPPPPPPPPVKPKPFVPHVIGPADCVITVGVKADPFDPAKEAVVVPLLGVGPIETTVFGTKVFPPSRNPKASGPPGYISLDLLFDASTRASKRFRKNQDDFNEIWTQLQTQGKVAGKPPSLIPIYATTFNNGRLIFDFCWLKFERRFATHPRLPI
jgi:hypothetical protein